MRGGCRGYPLVNYKQSIDINKNNTRVPEIEPRDVIQVYVSKIHVIKSQSATLVSRLSRTVKDVFGRDAIREVEGRRARGRVVSPPLQHYNLVL